MVPQIPIENLYYLLCYAWDVTDQLNKVKVDGEHSHSLENLLASVLTNAPSRMYAGDNITGQNESQARQGAKYDEKVYTQKLNQQALQAAGRFMNELYMNAGVKDKRYLFF